MNLLSGRIRVLLVEADPDMVERVERSLDAGLPAGWRLVPVASLREAVRRLEGESFDIALVDLAIHDGPGLVSLAELRNRSPETPVIMLVDDHDEGLGLEAVADGAEDYILRTSICEPLLAHSIHTAIQRHRTRGALRASKNRLRTRFRQIPVPILIWQRGTSGFLLVDHNRAAEAAAKEIVRPVRGLNAESLAGRMEGLLDDLEHCLNARETFTRELPHRDERGEERWLVSTYVCLSGDLVMMHIEDATERKQATEALRDSEIRYHSLYEHSLDGVVLMTPGGHILAANPAACGILGRSEEELLGLGEYGIFDRTDARFDVAFEERRRTRNFRGELTLLRPRGALFPAEVSLACYTDERGRDWCSLLLRDMTERNAAEAALRETETQLRQSQKMEAVGRLAGGIAHDFNNLLTVIEGHVEMMLADAEDADPNRLDLLEVKRAAERATSLTRQLLAFSRRQVLQPRIFDLTTVIPDLQNMIRRLIGEDIVLRTSIAEDVGRIRADPGQIEQVVLNLAVNARDAMPEGGRLAVEVRNAEIEAAYARRFAYPVLTGHYVLIEVTDTGVGMDEETVANIFEPFYTTKEKGKGTGLGLATVYGIVKQSGGYIWTESSPGRGTTFRIFLPRVTELAADRTPSEPAGALRGAETVLLVEDEAAVRSLTRRILTRNGYDVLDAENGAAALAICQAHDGPIHLVVTDVVMPEVGGRKLASQLAILRPETRVLFMSGYTEDAIAQHGVLAPGTAFLEKPFTAASLLAKVRGVLDAPLDVHGRS